VKFPKWLLIFILIQTIIVCALAALIIINRQQSTVGPKGDTGESATVDYKLLTDYVEEEIAKIPHPTNGVNGNNATNEQVAQAVAMWLLLNPPAAGANGTDGADSTVPGPTGETGPAAPKYEQRCRDFTTLGKKSQIQWKYDNEETWKLLYELPHKCNGDLI
jgi:hypothetical protein